MASTASTPPAATPPLSIKTTLRLKSGYHMPALGFGVYKTPADVAETVVLHALKSGYRHVDTARFYRNEQPCGEALRASGIPRADMFITSKVPPNQMTYEGAVRSIDTSLSQSGLDYFDLYLIHCPYASTPDRLGVWRALVEGVEAGKIRSIGVSNYGVHHLDELEAYIKQLEHERGSGGGGTLSVNQCELHPWCARPDILSWCRARHVVFQAYCPLARNSRAEERVLKELAAKYGRSTAQILVRWSLQMGCVPLPKTVTPARIEENADVFGFEIDGADMQRLDTGVYEPVAWDPTTSE